MDNNTINKLIFDTLASRKSILIEGIATVVIVRKGSNVSNPKKINDYPHYELNINNSPASVDLKALIGNQERYNSWFNSVCREKGASKIITIPNCVEIKMRSHVVKSIVSSEELNLQLNPFTPRRKAGHNGSIFKISLLILLLLVGAFYLIFTLVSQPSEPIEQEVVIPEKVVYILQDNETFDFDTTQTLTGPIIATDSLLATDAVPETAPERVPVTPSKSVADGLTEPIYQMSYIVVGSFRTLDEALSDRNLRLKKKYSDLLIHTTKKSKGGYINYIYTTTSYDEAMLTRDKLSNQYPEIKGMWVYRYL